MVATILSSKRWPTKFAVLFFGILIHKFLAGFRPNSYLYEQTKFFITSSLQEFALIMVGIDETIDLLNRNQATFLQFTSPWFGEDPALDLLEFLHELPVVDFVSWCIITLLDITVVDYIVNVRIYLAITDGVSRKSIKNMLEKWPRPKLQELKSAFYLVWDLVRWIISAPQAIWRSVVLPALKTPCSSTFRWLQRVLWDN
jgi:hypothetical protein